MREKVNFRSEVVRFSREDALRALDGTDLSDWSCLGAIRVFKELGRPVKGDNNSEQVQCTAG
jgi:hypothetical protein